MIKIANSVHLYTVNLEIDADLFTTAQKKLQYHISNNKNLHFQL